MLICPRLGLAAEGKVMYNKKSCNDKETRYAEDNRR